MNRRELITGLISLVAAPAIVRAGSLMPVKMMLPEGMSYFDVLYGKIIVDPIWFAILTECENDIIKVTGISMEDFYK